MRWLFLLLLIPGLAWAADSPEAQSLTLTPTRGSWGDLALEVSWDAYGPELRPGKGWVTLGGVVRVPPSSSGPCWCGNSKTYWLPSSAWAKAPFP